MRTNEKISAQTRLGFIGLGYLGSRIAGRLVDAEFRMTVWDRDPEKAAQFAARGAEIASGPGELARNVDVVLSCLPDDAAVQDVYFENGDLLGTRGRYKMIIELSTIAPETSQRLHAAGKRRGISVLDVAISGSTHAAESGALSLFGGGERAAFDMAEPIFRAIAGQWFYMGPGGSGVAMKLVVNAMLGLGMEAIAESLALGSALGLSHDLLFDTLAKTAVVAPAHVGKLASAKRSDYAPQFPIRLMRKDFSLILSEASRLKVRMPATKAAASINSDEASGAQEEDFSAVIRRVEQESEIDRSVPLSGLV